MDIYVLRDGQELGPFSEEATHSFLSQGTIVMDDLAWTPGLPEWSPLEQVLYPASAPIKEELVEDQALEQEPVEAEQTAMPPDEWHAASEPATAKQKAFLCYMGIPFSNETTKEHAAVLMNEAMEDPAQNARVLQWNDDRLRLHPELFSAELQAKKDDRANRFHSACHHEGAEIFTDVTKAHCQVLVGFLDVNFPNWDAHEADAAWHYFFPAVAEKFPPLVRNEWREKLKYKTANRVATTVLHPATAKLRSGPSPIGALIRGAVFGLALLLALYVGVELFTGEPDTAAQAPAEAKPAPAIPPEPPKISDSPAPKAEVAPEAKLDPMKTEMASSAATAEPPATAPPAADPPPRVAAPKTEVTVTKAVDVKLHLGSAKLYPGKRFKIIARDAASVTVILGAETVSIPIEATDLAEPPPAQ